MRSDMQKIIVERPRHGSARPNQNSGSRLYAAQVRAAIEAGEDYDSGPARASSGRRDKSLNENLAPLRRYLTGQVGRPWNKVYSEIRQTLDLRSAIGLHVMQHLQDFVTINTVMREGVVCGRRRWWRFEPVEGMYVHPITGLLRIVKSGEKSDPNSKADGQQPNCVRLSEHLEYKKIKGIWFLVEHAEVEAAGTKGQTVRVLVRKRQCDSKTIRRIERGELGPLTVQQD